MLHNFEHDGDLLVSKLNLRPELLDCLTLIESRLISRYHVSEALDLLFVLGGFDTFGQVVDGLLGLFNVLFQIVLLTSALFEGDIADIFLLTHIELSTRVAHGWHSSERLVLMV